MPHIFNFDYAFLTNPANEQVMSQATNSTPEVMEVDFLVSYSIAPGNPSLCFINVLTDQFNEKVNHHTFVLDREDFMMECLHQYKVKTTEAKNKSLSGQRSLLSTGTDPLYILTALLEDNFAVFKEKRILEQSIQSIQNDNNSQLNKI